MRKLTSALLAGAGVLLIGGAAIAASQNYHVMRVALPDGAIAQVRYEGKQAPRVFVTHVPLRGIDAATGRQLIVFEGAPLAEERVVPVVGTDPLFDVGLSPLPFFGSSAFADLDRISAMMDAQANAMMRQVAAMQQAAFAGPSAWHTVSTDAAAPGMVRYSYVSTSTGNGTCVRSVEWSSDGSGDVAKVTRTSSGDCATAPAAKATATSTATIPGAHKT